MGTRIYERELGAVEIIQYKNGEGVNDDYVLMPARVLQEVGLEVYEDSSCDPPVIRVRAGAPRAETDLSVAPSDVVSPLEDETPIEDVVCPSCQTLNLVYTEGRNRYDCRSCHSSHVFGELIARSIFRKIKTIPTWTTKNSHLSISKVRTSDNKIALLATDMRGNFIGVEMPT